MGNIKTVGYFGLIGKLPNVDIGPRRTRRVNKDRLTHELMTRYGHLIAVMDTRTRVLEHVGSSVQVAEAKRLLRATSVADDAVVSDSYDDFVIEPVVISTPGVEEILGIAGDDDDTPLAPLVDEIAESVSGDDMSDAELQTLLNEYSKDDLLALADVHGLTLSKSLKKGEIVAELLELDELDLTLLDDESAEEVETEDSADAASDDLLSF